MKKLLATAALVVALPLAAGAWEQYQPRGYGQPTIQTRPNIFGGVTIDQGFGQPRIETRPNIFGGYDIDRGFGQPRITCRPNIFGGQDCR